MTNEATMYSNFESDPSVQTARGNGKHAEATLGVFTGAAVVQLVSGSAESPDAVVSTLHGATVTVTASRIVAEDGPFDWSWLVAELQSVVVGADEPWAILSVPGVSDFGVSVRADQAEEFLRVLFKVAARA